MLSCYRIAVTESFEKATAAERAKLLNGWNYDESNSVTNAVRWNVSLADGLTAAKWTPMPPFTPIEFEKSKSLRSGHQLEIPLLEFEPPDTEKPLGKSGLELRVVLEPLTFPPTKSAPNEMVHTNHVSGRGLAGMMEDALARIGRLSIDQ